MRVIDPYNIIANHYPSHFCVTGSEEVARSFAHSHDVGLIALRNANTIQLAQDIDAYNLPHYQVDMTEEEEHEIDQKLDRDSKHIKACAIKLIMSIIAISIDEKFCATTDVIDNFGESDPPHIDTQDVTLILAGLKDPTTEVSKKSPVSLEQYPEGEQPESEYCPIRKKSLMTQWGRVNSSAKDYGIFSPISFLRGTALILLSDRPSGVLHCIPEVLRTDSSYLPERNVLKLEGSRNRV